jgi:5-methyltetrahydropteroyltriglutamate--homocysteine methyltransferase
MRSTSRILTTHVGSMPRSKAVTELVYAEELDQPLDTSVYQREIAGAVHEIVARQVAAGVDLVSDGEMSKLSYATYIRHRMTGFEGDSPRRTPQDLEDFPAYAQRAAKGGATPTYRRPRCVAPITVKSMAPLEFDLTNLRAAAEAAQPTGAFMNAASPGVIALFQPDDFYGDHETYLTAIAAAMRPEYQAIVAAGFLLQIDAPDLGVGRHMMFKDRSDTAFLEMAALHIRVLNQALDGIARDKVRLHICWGNYEGPHTRDIPLATILPTVLQANIGYLSFEAANPRHAHEWRVFAETPLPDDLVLMPGVLDSTTNFVEHPELIAERIERFAGIVGRERVIASSDCGFSTFAGFGVVDPDIVFAKLCAMGEGARIASARLWR